jgi:MoaA/NifB/PqqE/SkfB family radical SAM enzyme
MNLIITDVCNRNCPYCFAEFKLNRETRGAQGVPSSKKDRYISMENYLVYLDFLEKSSAGKVKFLGGEPTLHPRFTQLVDIGLERGFEVTIFTNGLWNDAVLEYFKGTASPLDRDIHSRVNFVFNLNQPQRQTEKENRLQERSLEIVGEHAKCGFNIYRTDFDLLFLGDIIEKYSLQKFIRMGLACPIANTPNEYIKTEDLKAAGTRLAGQLCQLEKRDILGTFDCGFSLCMFSEEELGSITLSTGGFKSLCSPIIDVGADLTAWPCFPLSSMFNVKLTDFKSGKELEEFYNEKFKHFRQFGSQDDCLGCKYLQRAQCAGGCLARGLVQWAKSDTAFFEKLDTK